MSKQVYISADYSANDGDLTVVEELNKWGNDDLHKVDFIDMSKVSSGSVSNNPDCRICDLKKEFNKQINASSVVIFVVGCNTASRTAGSSCKRAGKEQYECNCTPYKQNANGTKLCKVSYTTTPDANGDVGCINSYSYLKHEFEQAKKKGKPIIIVYNSLREEENWLPSYMNDFKKEAKPFWTKNYLDKKIGDYSHIKEALGYV